MAYLRLEAEMVTFIKLKSNGMWGVKIAGSGNLDAAAPGAGFVVTKRDGTTKDVTLAAKEETRADLGYEVWSIVETRPAGRYYPKSRSRGEQASFASQNAPYELAEPRVQTGQRLDYGDVVIETTLQRLPDLSYQRDQIRMAEADAELTPTVVAAEQEDPALVFQRLMGGAYTPGESSVRDARGGQ